jgi:hypothetical protein
MSKGLFIPIRTAWPIIWPIAWPILQPMEGERGSALIDEGNLVGRVGVEPTTKRLRACGLYLFSGPDFHISSTLSARLAALLRRFRSVSCIAAENAGQEDTR